MKKKEKKKENVKGKNTTIKKRKKKEYIYILCDLLGSQRESVRSRETGQYIKSEKGRSVRTKDEILKKKKGKKKTSSSTSLNENGVIYPIKKLSRGVKS